MDNKNTKTDTYETIINPALIFAFERAKNNNSEENQKRVIEEMLRAKFLAPVAAGSLPEDAKIGDTVDLKQNQNIAFRMIQDDKGNHYFPAFTDWQEVKKWEGFKDRKTLIVTFKDYMFFILKSKNPVDGLVVNPFGANVLFNREMINNIVAMIDAQAKEQNPQE